MSVLFALEDFAASVWRDFSTALTEAGEADYVKVAVVDEGDSAEVREAIPDLDEWRAPTATGDALYLLVTRHGMSALGSPKWPSAAMETEVASLLQDLVMDNRNSAWPRVRTIEGGTAVGEPAVVDGRAVWAAHGEGVAAIGRLAEVLVHDR